MTSTIIKNVCLLDGTGAEPYNAEVEIQNKRIKKISRDGAKISAKSGGEVIDGGGATLMPGMVEAHAHPSFTNFARFEEPGQIPPEEHVLLSLKFAQLLMDHGFTSLFCAASCKPRTDLVVRDFINSGDFEGPRMSAASPEFTVTGGMGDVSMNHLYQENFGTVCNGPDEFLKAVRQSCREGVDVIKINPSGDFACPQAKANFTMMTEEEIKASCFAAHSFGKRVAVHARNAESVKLSLKYGAEIIYHATLIDEEAKDMLEARKDEIFVAPTIGVTYAACYEAAEFGISAEDAIAGGFKLELETACENMKDLHKRGVRVLPGGDYGLIWNPNGKNARDIDLFVKLLGMSPMEAIISATQYGGQIMGMGDELGIVKEGYLADLLLVDGDPLKDVTILQNQDSFLMIMKDGQFRKRPDSVEKISVKAA
ncbi:MAG: amidohydrolase family protein [SAR324 cluster bacterium]|nr:amidohydrolase family protein [SAR324 cluster bacterium]